MKLPLHQRTGAKSEFEDLRPNKLHFSFDAPQQGKVQPTWEHPTV